MRVAIAGAVAAGLALAGVASIASAQTQTWLTGPLCPASQVGMPCNSNPYDLCLPTLCFHIEDRLNAAGMDAGVPTACLECTACVQADCRATGCPSGEQCQYYGTSQSPCGGGFGYGPASNPDQTVIINPQYSCLPGWDGQAPVPEVPPTCPNVTDWTDFCGGSSGGGGSSAVSAADAGSGQTTGSGPATDASSGTNGAAGSGGTGSGATGGGSGGGATGGGSSGPVAAAAAAPIVGADAGNAPAPQVLRSSCTIGRGPLAKGGARGAWSVALVMGLALARRRRRGQP